MQAALDYLYEVGVLILTSPWNMQEKFYFVYVLTFLVMAAISYRLYYRSGTSNFWRFVFPKKIYWHPSARIDYGVYLVNILLSPLILVGAGLQTWLSIQLGAWLIDLNSGNAVIVGSWSPTTYLIFIIGYTLIADLSVYLVHRLHHQSDVLWPIHALHHSAQVLTPFTLFRKHPLWNLISHLANVTLTGIFQGVFIFFFYGGPAAEILFGINSVYVLYNFFGANLRHSHIWLSWGKPLSFLFISPAMHQIHHDAKRMDKNYGEVFAIWDAIFGSLYIPNKRETFQIGLGENIPNPHTSLTKAFLIPLQQSGRQLKIKIFGKK